MRRAIQLVGVLGFTAILAGQSVEQTSEGLRGAVAIVAQFDALGVGFEGPQGTATLRNPCDNSVAVGGDATNFAGRRFAARRAGDPLGQLTDCTICYVGDYVKKDASSSSSRVGAFRIPGCTP